MAKNESARNIGLREKKLSGNKLVPNGDQHVGSPVDPRAAAPSSKTMPNPIKGIPPVPGLV